MRTSSKVITGIVLLGLIFLIGSQMTGRAIDEPGPYDAFAQALTASGAKMYGAYWCPHCQNQKKMFGSSFQYIDYIECDPRGDDANPDACQAAGIKGYPTWVFGDGSRASGELSLQQLSQRSGVPLE